MHSIRRFSFKKKSHAQTHLYCPASHRCRRSCRTGAAIKVTLMLLPEKRFHTESVTRWWPTWIMKLLTLDIVINLYTKRKWIGVLWERHCAQKTMEVSHRPGRETATATPLFGKASSGNRKLPPTSAHCAVKSTQPIKRGARISTSVTSVFGNLHYKVVGEDSSQSGAHSQDVENVSSSVS
jgi:hypothetical protein